MKALNLLEDTHLGDVGQAHLIVFFKKRHRTETHTHKGGNPGLISHNSQHTKPIFNISYKLNLIISIISNQSYQTINF